jgi:hypothetical protein
MMLCDVPPFEKVGDIHITSVESVSPVCRCVSLCFVSTMDPRRKDVKITRNSMIRVSQLNNRVTLGEN